MEKRIAGLLGKDDQVDLIRIEFKRRVGPGDNLLAVLLLHVLADRQHADIGENCLRRHDFDPARLGGVLVAGKTNDVDPIVGENETAGRRIAAVVDLDRHGAFSGWQDRRHEPARSRLDELVMPNRFAADERDPRHGADHILERIRPRRLGDHEFRNRRFRPGLPGRRAVVDKRSHRQVLTGHEDLLEVEFRRRRGGRARRRVRGAAEENVGRPERQNCDGPDDDQLPVHETTALQTPTRTRADLDIAIVKVRLIESIELTINV